MLPIVGRDIPNVTETAELSLFAEIYVRFIQSEVLFNVA